MRFFAKNVVRKGLMMLAGATLFAALGGTAIAAGNTRADLQSVLAKQDGIIIGEIQTEPRNVAPEGRLFAQAGKKKATKAKAGKKKAMKRKGGKRKATKRKGGKKKAMKRKGGKKKATKAKAGKKN